MNKMDFIKFKNQTYKFIKVNFVSCLSWAITIAWLIFIFIKIRSGKLPYNLNEFGDFIAGAFAPLAFFWLVRGYYQQGKELQQNTEALNLQAQELQNSVQEQKNLFTLQQDEIKAKHFAVRPFFSFSVSKLEMESVVIDEYWNEKGELAGELDADIGRFKLIVKNLGESARHFSIVDQSDNLHIYNIFEVSKESVNEITLLVNPDEMEDLQKNQPLERRLIVNFFDVYGKNFKKEILITIVRDAFSKSHFNATCQIHNVINIDF